MQHLFDVAFGAALVAGGYFVYVATTKGLPAALARLRTWWTRGKAALAKIEGDVADAQTTIAGVEQRLADSIAGLTADVEQLKAVVHKAGL